MTLKQKIEAIEALKDKISAGPWELRESSDERPYIFSKKERDMFSPLVKTYRDDKPGRPNAEFIAASRNTIFDLIDMLKEAEDVFEKLKTINCRNCRAGDDSDDWLSKYNGGES